MSTPMPDHPRVLISYSHDSEEHRERIRQLAGRLRVDGIDAWIDQYSPAPDEGWPRWMKAEFARAHFIIVVCSPGYAERFDRGPGHGSGVGWEAVLIQQELYEKGGNTRFIPVFFDGDEHAVPTELRRFRRHCLPTDYEALLRHLAGQLGVEPPRLGPPSTSSPLPAATLQSEGARPGLGVRRIPWNAPSLPDQYLPREELDSFKLSLIAKDPRAIAVAGQHHRLGVQGMPGVGKTLLAAALAWDEDLQEAFPGGVFWLTLGRTPDDATVWQGKLGAALTDRKVEIRTLREGKATLGELFDARLPSLLILDDVWRVEDAEPFNALKPPHRLLVTTRNREVALGLGATVRELNELKAAQGLALLAAYSGRALEALPPIAPEIVRECGELPLALAMAGSMLRGRPDDRWPTLLAQLQKADLAYLAAALPDYGEHRNMLAAIEVSVQELPEGVRRRFLDFAVFDEDVAVPEGVVHFLWRDAGVDLATAQGTVDALVDRSLLRRDVQGRLTLHDLQHDYVRAHDGDVKARHTRLLDAYRNAAPGRSLYAVASDGYFFEHGPRHLVTVEGPRALRDLLFEHRWLFAKLNATSASALLADFELLDLASDEPLRLLRDALRLSAHALGQRPEELPSQLLGRLRGVPEPGIHYLCARVEADAAWPSVLPLWPNLQPPGGALFLTLGGHTGPVNAVALSADGKTVVSSSRDATLKVWDLETGRERRTLKGHAAGVNAVALSADGKTAISGSGDRTLKVWDLETSQERRTLKGHTGRVTAVALSADGKTAISGSSDRTLKVWDMETGRERRTLEGHADGVTAVVLSANGKIAVSGSLDKALKVWDVESGWVQRTLEGHSGCVNAVALSVDEKTVISGSRDRTLKVWDVETGRERRTLEGHTGFMNAVALSADGKTAVSGSRDRMLKVWDLEVVGRERRTPASHSNWVDAVVLSADGKTAITGSSDRTLKVWNLEMGRERRTLVGHRGRVTAVALSADGKTAVSGSHDRTLKVWDVETGRERRTLAGDGGRVNAVALSADGKTVVSGADDRTLHVWDVEMGRERRTLEGHAGRVTAVVLSADAKTIISGADDKTLKVWDVETGRERLTLEGHADRVIAVALSADSRTIISGSDDRTLKVWEVETGRERRTLAGHGGRVTAVALSEDGKTAVSGSHDKTLKVWDVEAGSCLTSFTGDADFRAIALSQEMHLVAGDTAGRVHLLELRLGPDLPRTRRS